NYISPPEGVLSQPRGSIRGRAAEQGLVEGVDDRLFGGVVEVSPGATREVGALVVEVGEQQIPQLDLGDDAVLEAAPGLLAAPQHVVDPLAQIGLGRLDAVELSRQSSGAVEEPLGVGWGSAHSEVLEGPAHRGAGLLAE